MRMCLALTVAAVAGCSSSSSPARAVRPSAATVPADAASLAHAYDRERMRFADAGPYRAALTAHLSKHGHELDVFLETADDDPKPVAVGQASIVARATRAGDSTEHPLTFDPAPADERPRDEPAGQCSHFVARADWLKPDDVLTVKCQIALPGMTRAVVWTEFVPRKYAHADDSPTDVPVP